MCLMSIQHPNVNFKQAAIYSSLEFRRGRTSGRQRWAPLSGRKFGVDKMQEAEKVTKDSFRGRRGVLGWALLAPGRVRC